ncbi:MAG: TIGR03087 family PEP-CTERM/XrtA system glycosyltransferase [bacterium]|nr:TIGR03087 family PEP-CTERM/XrtA system glycosyltransferase [bacterium]
MNVLYLAHRLPFPPNKGDKIRSYHQLEFLARRHRVWCACFVDDPADRSHVDTLRQSCHELAAIGLDRRWATARGLWHLLRGRTLTEGFYDDPRMWSVLEAWRRTVTFDTVMVYSSSMAPYGLASQAPRRVIDFCDWDSLKWAAYAQTHRGLRSRLLAIESRRLRQREAQRLTEFDAATVITKAEADDAPAAPKPIQGMGFNERGIGLPRRAPVRVVGNGITLRPYTPPPPEPRVGFVGAMDYAPNVEAVCRFAAQTWPLIRREIPRATFDIIGRRPTAKVKALAGTPGIRVVGEVPEIGEWVDRLAVHIAPLAIARGLQNKVLDAMGAGRPVVLSPQAARGIDAEHDREYVVAEEPDATARAVVQLLTDRDQTRTIGLAAREFVGRHFDWDRELAKLEALLGVAGPHDRPSGAGPDRVKPAAQTSRYSAMSATI